VGVNSETAGIATGRFILNPGLLVLEKGPPAPPDMAELVDTCIVYLLIPLGSVASVQSKKGVGSFVNAAFIGVKRAGAVGTTVSTVKVNALLYVPIASVPLPFVATLQ